MTQGTHTGALRQSRGVGCEDRWEELQEEGDIGVPMADSC